MDAGHLVYQIIFGQHDLADFCVKIRLVFLHPQDFGRGEAGERDVAGAAAEGCAADLVVEVVCLFGGAAVVPKDGRAQDSVAGIQGDQAMHLPANADAFHLGGVKPLQQHGDAFQAGFPPIRGVLFAPAGVGHAQGIFPGYLIADLTFLIHQQEFAGRGAKVNADIQHADTAFRCSFAKNIYISVTYIILSGAGNVNIQIAQNSVVFCVITDKEFGIR